MQNDIKPDDQLPHNIEAEQQLLGAIFGNNDLAFKLSFLKADQFFDPVHQRIFENTMARINAGRIASPVSLKADMEHDEGLRELGGPSYLARLLAASVASSAIVDYAMIITEMASRRALIDVCDAAKARMAADEDAAVAVADLEVFLHQQEPVGEPRSTSLLKAHTDAIQEVLDLAKGDNPAIPTGIAALDDALSLRRGRYTMIAGTTSMGKTAVAQWLSYSAAKAGFGVGFVSLEMPERDLAARLNSIDSRIPYKAFERPMSEATLRKVVQAARDQEALPIQIFNARVNDLGSIVSEAKKLQHKWQPNERFKGLGLLVIDYIQLVKGKGTDFEVLSSVANDLKQIAKTLDVHVIALAQVGTKVMERDNARPGLSDLRGSGDLGMAPDNVVFCHREEYYLERKHKPTKTDELADYYADLESSRGKMELIVAKARMGELGIVTVGCDMATNRFWDLESTSKMEV